MVGPKTFPTEKKKATDELKTLSTLSRFRIILKFFSLIGTFPCTLHENFTLKPIYPWTFLSKWLFVSSSLLISAIASIFYMVNKATNGFTLSKYFSSFVSSTNSSLDAAAFVAPLFISLYMAVGFIWSARSMGQSIVIFEDHIFKKIPPNAEELSFWELFLDVVIGPLM